MGYLFLPCLFCLVALYDIPSSAVYFSVFSFGLTYWVWGLLSAGWKVVVPLNCGVYSPWVGWDQCLVKVSWLEGLVPVSWWMELDLVFLEGSAVSSSVFWGVYWFRMALAACLLMCNVVLFCWRIGVGHSALELAGFWVGLCLSVERRLLGGFSCINVLWGQELFSGPKSGSWVFLLCDSSPTPYCNIKISQDTLQKTK